jgi:hypothetical protein
VYVNLDGWVEIVKPNVISVKAIHAKMEVSVPILRVPIIALVHKVTLVLIVISAAVLVIAILAAMVELALTAATEQSSIVFALLVPQAKLANKITGMSVLMILARTEDVLTVLETTTVHVNQNGEVKTVMSMTKPVLEALTSPTDVISSSTFTKNNRNVFKISVAKRLEITVAMKNAIIIFAAMMETTVVKELIPGRIVMPLHMENHAGMYFKMAHVIKLVILKNAFLMV